MLRSLTACFTGHRPEKLPWGSNESDSRCVALKNRIFDVVQSLYHAGIRHYICGMARGCDTFFCEAVISLRDEHDDVTLEAAIPFDGQASAWPEEEKRRYYYLVSECDNETVLQHEYTKECYINRNRYMVDRSSILVAVYDGTSGGTRQTVSYAAKSGLEVITLDPDPINRDE